MHKILRAVRKGQFSTPAKFTSSITTLKYKIKVWHRQTHVCGRFGPLGQRRNLVHCTLYRRCIARAVIKRCTHDGGAVVSVLRVGTELLERCQAFKQRSIAVMNCSLALVWRCLCGTNARFRSLPLHQRYSNAGFSGAPLSQRPCYPYFVRGDERCRNVVPSPFRSRNAATTFARWELGLTITCIVVHIVFF